MDVLDRFLAKVKKGRGCWEWIGAMRGPGNYGAFTIGRKCISAPRFAYESLHGKIPNGQILMHSCDNRKCVRPSHLEAGTQSKNIRDCVARGRHVPPKGARNGMSKLTDEKVAEIRSAYDGKRGSMTRLAREYHVAVPTIHSIIRRSRWK